MAGVPTKRLLVYIVAGVVVLAVGTAAVVGMRGGSSREGDLVGSAVSISTLDEGGGSGPPEVTDRAGTGTGSGGAEPAAGSTTTETVAIFVQVAGAVRSPGVYTMPPMSRVFQAIDKAGGFAIDADQQAIALAAGLTDGCRVYVPRLGEGTAGNVAAPGGTTSGVSAEGPGPAGSAPLSINSAGIAELDSLPGVGPAIAEDIVTYRETNGPFASIDELAEVPGIGPSKLEKLRPLVTL